MPSPQDRLYRLNEQHSCRRGRDWYCASFRFQHSISSRRLWCLAIKRAWSAARPELEAHVAAICRRFGLLHAGNAGRWTIQSTIANQSTANILHTHFSDPGPIQFGVLSQGLKLYRRNLRATKEITNASQSQNQQDRSHAADRGMSAKAIIIAGTPMFDKESGLGEGGKPMLVKAVVAKGAIEAFNESVLHGLPRLDVMKGDARRLKNSLSPVPCQRSSLWIMALS